MNALSNEQPHMYALARQIAAHLAGWTAKACPEALAKEILRRLLPGYLSLWSEQDRKRQQAEQSDREAEALVRRLEDLFGLAHRDHNRRGRNDAMHVYYERATFTVYRYGSCKVDISSDDAESVVRIAELVKTLKAED